MKQWFILVLSLSLTFLNANNKISDDKILKQLIKRVKESKDDERRKAMNDLKVKLRSLNQNTRIKVMRSLQKSFTGRHQTEKMTNTQNISPMRNIQRGSQQSVPLTIPRVPSHRPGQRGGRR